MLTSFFSLDLESFEIFSLDSDFLPRDLERPYFVIGLLFRDLDLLGGVLDRDLLVGDRRKIGDLVFLLGDLDRLFLENGLLPRDLDLRGLGLE